jgi:hypothetical protein
MKAQFFKQQAENKHFVGKGVEVEKGIKKVETCNLSIMN